MQSFDLVLVLGFFRRTAHYLSIIKFLSKNHKIGLFPIPLDEGLRKKHAKTQDIFIQKCVNLGAELIENPIQIHAKLAVFPQEPYLPKAIQRIQLDLSWKRSLAIMALPWGGRNSEFIKELGIKKLLVVDKAFFEFVLPHRGGKETFEDHEIIEVGLPYSRYPIFNEIQGDYIFAIPTQWSFPHEKDKHLFLNTVLSLFSKIDSGERIIFKSHNATDTDYFSSRLFRIFPGFLSPMSARFVQGIVKLMSVIKLSKANGLLEQFYTAVLYKKVLNRVTSLEHLTPYHEFALEAFLPGIKKGVIGGLSNTIWGALFFKLPFYNCADLNAQNRQAENRLYRKKPKGGQALELNLEYFNVPYCNNELKFKEKYFNIIAESTRDGDLIGELKKELKKQD